MCEGTISAEVKIGISERYAAFREMFISREVSGGFSSIMPASFSVWSSGLPAVPISHVEMSRASEEDDEMMRRTVHFNRFRPFLL